MIQPFVDSFIRDVYLEPSQVGSAGLGGQSLVSWTAAFYEAITLVNVTALLCLLQETHRGDTISVKQICVNAGGIHEWVVLIGAVVGIRASRKKKDTDFLM